MKDTSNLLAEGIVKLGDGWRQSSLKGEATMDWDSQKQRQQLLTQMVQHGRRVLSLAEKVKEEHPERGGSHRSGRRSAEAVDDPGCGREAGRAMPDQAGDGKGSGGQGVQDP